MPGIERFALGYHGPQDACVLVGQRHGGLLPTGTVSERCSPLGDGVAAFVGRHHHWVVARMRGDELAAAQHMAGGIDGVNLDHALGQVDSDAYGFSSRSSTRETSLALD